MTTAEDEIDTFQEQTPIQVEAALASANTYTDGKDTVLRNDMAIADTSTLNTAKSYANQVVAALVDNSPEALNTLQELAKALGNDPNFATTVMQAIGERMKTTDVNAALAGKLNAEGETALSGEASAVVFENTGTGGAFTRKASILLKWYNEFAGVSVLRGGASNVYGLGININNEIVAEFIHNALYIKGNVAYHSGNLGPATTAANGLMTKEDKAKLQWGLIAGGRVSKTSGSIDSNDQWGCKACQGIKYNNQQGKYKITHNIGHTKYSISITPVNQGWAKINGHILEKTGTYIVVGMFDTSNDNSTVDFEFEFMLCGVN